MNGATRVRGILKDKSRAIEYYKISAMQGNEASRKELARFLDVWLLKRNKAAKRGLLKGLSAFLGKRFGKGYLVSTLMSARKFYQTYALSISQSKLAEWIAEFEEENGGAHE